MKVNWSESRKINSLIGSMGKDVFMRPPSICVKFVGRVGRSYEEVGWFWGKGDDVL